MRKKRLIPFLEGEARNEARWKPGYFVRLLHPKGLYPKARIAHKDALYWADKDLAFFVTWSEPWDMNNSLPFSEIDWATAHELRLLGSILLCECLESPLIRFYPVHRFSMPLNAKHLNLSSPTIARAIKDSIIEKSWHPNLYQGEGAIGECLHANYDLFKASDFDLSRQPEFFSSIQLDDHLLLRGLGALIKATMLASYYEFNEEAIVIAFIAMEVSFQMVLRELKQNGNSDPSAADAAEWLHKHFNEPFGQSKVGRYFEDVYDQRVMTLHPANRFGVIPYAPLFHDDFTLLRRDVPAIFAYLITGKHSPDYLDAVERFGRKQAVCKP